jgi:hypothetical protein
MGWCSGTLIFDKMAEFVINSPQSEVQKVATLAYLAESLENEDWDCQQDSRFYDHPIVKRVMRQLHPDWESLKDESREGIIDNILADLPEPARNAMRIAASYGQTDGAHHLTWVIDQMVHAMIGVHYKTFVEAYESGEDGRHTYTWDEGVAP